MPVPPNPLNQKIEELWFIAFCRTFLTPAQMASGRAPKRGHPGADVSKPEPKRARGKGQSQGIPGDQAQSLTSSSSSSQQSEGFPAISLDIVKELCPVAEEEPPLQLSQESFASSVDESTLRQFSPLRSPERYRKGKKRGKKTHSSSTLAQPSTARRALVFQETPEVASPSGTFSISPMPTTSVTIQFPSTVVTCTSAVPHSVLELQSVSHSPGVSTKPQHLLSSRTLVTFDPAIEPSKRSPRRVSPRRAHRSEPSAPVPSKSPQASGSKSTCPSGRKRSKVKKSGMTLRPIAPASSSGKPSKNVAAKLKAALRRRKMVKEEMTDEQRKQVSIHLFIYTFAPIALLPPFHHSPGIIQVWVEHLSLRDFL